MLTDDLGLARSLSRLRVHGMEPKYYHHEVGFNSRLDAIQAAVLRVKLRHLDAWTQKRRDAAVRYQGLFETHRLTDQVVLPCERGGNLHVFNQYVIRVPATLRDPLRDHLAARQIGTEIYYPIPLHLQPCFVPLGYVSGDFPNSESAARKPSLCPSIPSSAKNNNGSSSPRSANSWIRMPTEASAPLIRPHDARVNPDHPARR